MRIAMLSYHTCPLATLGGKEGGGMNVYVRELVQSLGERGIGVDVFTRSQDEHVAHVLHDLGYGNRVVHVPSGPEHPLAKDELPKHLDQYVAGIFDFAERKGIAYDVIDSHYWLSGQAALALKERWGLSVVQMFHTLGEMKNAVARAPHEQATPERLEMERQLLKQADRIVVSTEAELAHFRALYSSKAPQAVIIDPGVDPTHFYRIDPDEAREFVGAEPGRRLVLFVGRIEPLKGLDSLLEAVDLLQDHSLQLMVIGGEPEAGEPDLTDEMRRLQRMVQERGLEDTVTFLGRRDQAALPYYYSAAEMLVMPSHYESFGMVALEAMSCGTPVVASETGGLVHLVQDGETGLHAPADSPGELADRIRMLLEDEALRARLGRQASDYAHRYSWAQTADETLALYRELTQMTLAAD